MITFDYETRSYSQLVGANGVGAYKYSQDPTTEVMCAGWLFSDSPANLGHLGHWHFGTTGQDEWDATEQSPDETLEELAWRIEDGEPIEAHNAFFEQMIWEFAWLRQLPWMPLPKPDQWYCSAAKAASFALPRKLETLANVLGGVEKKDMEGHRIMLKLCKPARQTKKAPNRQWWERPEDIERNWDYNAQDVRTEHWASSQLRPLTDSERQVWLLDQRMNKRGVFCDRRLVDSALELAAAGIATMNKRCVELTNGEVPKGSSRPKLKKWVNERLLPGEEIEDTKGLTVELKLKTELPEDVAEVLSICLEVNKTSLKKYKSMDMRMSDLDCRIRDLMMYHGASTGRWAGTGIQPHNFPRGSIKDMAMACEAILTRDPEFIEIIYGSLLEHLSGSLRGALMAPEGRDLIVADYSAVEARDVFWLAGDTAGLDAFRESDAGRGPEAYCVMAEDIFGYPVDKSMPHERFIGKQTILGAGYGMGHEKWLDTCAKFGVILDEKIGRKAIDTYREIHFPVEDMWKAQEKAAISAVKARGKVFECGKVSWAVRGKFLHCKLPSGRLLSYYKPRLSTMLNIRFQVRKPNRNGTSQISMNKDPREEDDRFGKGEQAAIARAYSHCFGMCKENGWEMLKRAPYIREQSILRYYGTDAKTKKFKLQETYGGKLTENITQAVARDQLAEAMVRIDCGGVYDMILSVHDESIGEVDQGKGDLKEFEYEMAIPPAWCLDAPLVAVGWRGERYRKA